MKDISTLVAVFKGDPEVLTKTPIDKDAVEGRDLGFLVKSSDLAENGIEDKEQLREYISELLDRQKELILEYVDEQGFLDEFYD